MQAKTIFLVSARSSTFTVAVYCEKTVILKKYWAFDPTLWALLKFVHVEHLSKGRILQILPPIKKLGDHLVLLLKVRLPEAQSRNADSLIKAPLCDPN